MRERITLLKAADGAFDCLIEVRDQPPVSCRLRYGPDNQPRVEIDRNGDGKPEQIVESGRDGSGAVFEKTSYVDSEGRLTSSLQETLSDDGLKKQVLYDLNGDGVIEERRSFVTDELGNEVISAQTLKDDGQVSSELLIRSDTGRQLSFYELIVNGKTENLGFISQPVDDELIARLSQRLGVTNNLRDTYAYGGVLTDTIMLSARDNRNIAHELSARFIDAQLQSFDERSAYPGLETAPSLLPSRLVQEKILAELAQFSDRAVVDVRFNLDNEMMLVGSRRMVLVRADGSVRRQLVEAGGAQTVEELDADGVLRSTFTAKSPVDMPGAAMVTYAFNYRDGTSANIDTLVLPGLPQQTSLRLSSGTFNIDAVYGDGQLQGIQQAVIYGRELSPGARAALSKQLADMSADELHAAFLDMQAQGQTPDATGGAAPKLNVTLEEARRELIATTDNFGNPLYVNRQERQLQALGDRVSTLIDGLTLLQSLKTGKPLPIVASGLRLAADFDMLDGTRDLPNLGGAASAAGTVLSLYGLANALEEGDAAAAGTSASFAVAGFLQTAQFLAKSGAIAPLSGSTVAFSNSLNQALPYINLANSIAHGDTTGVAVAVTDIALMNAGAYAVPVIGWAYAIYSLVDGLFTEVPDPWGNARFVWRDGALAIDAAGETGGEEAVRNVMQAVLSSMSALIERERQQNPGSQLGIISNRMPGLVMKMDGYRFTDIDALSGADRNPALRFDMTGRPYNAAAGSPESFIGLVEGIIRAALSREAIAPLWEVRTAQLQTLAGDPRAGLREEERAGIDGLLAAPVSGDTQLFRPIVLDLDGDGIDQIVRAQGVLFDIDSSGFSKRTAWVGADDAFLVLDRNYNGLIDSGREMFSNAQLAMARRGRAGMAWTDANYDGRITSADPVWEELRLWRDLNANGQQDEGETRELVELGVSELNYSMGTYTRDRQTLEMSSPDLEADAQGVRANSVPQGILIEGSEDRKLSLLVTRIDDRTAIEPLRDGVAGIEDVELLVSGADLLANDLLGGFSGRRLSLDGLTNFRHGTGFIDANGIIHFQPEPDYAGEGAGFDYRVRAPNGQAGVGSVDLALAPVNDAPTLAAVENASRSVYGYMPIDYPMMYVDETGLEVWQTPPGSGIPVYSPWIERVPEVGLVHHDKPVAQEPTGVGRIAGADIDDPASTLRYELVSAPQYGEVSVEADGSFRYTSWKEPGVPSDRVLLQGQYAGWKGGALYNASTVHSRAVFPTEDVFQVRISDPHGAGSVVNVTVPHLGPYLPPLPPGGGGKKPIAIDLDGDGFEFVDVDDSAIFFDVTDDGWKRRTSWIGKDDGLLAHDIDGDGKIDKPGEIAFAGKVDGAQTDLEGLAAFDSNRDGKFDASDRDWSHFGIWQDGNQNGLTDPGEFRTLEQVGVQAVQLASDGQFRIINGQTVHGIGQVQLKDGHVLAMADVTLAFSQERQLPDGRTITPASPFSPAGAPIDGSDGKDLIPGRRGSDVITAGSGDDVVIDDGGNDIVQGGAGNDTLFTGADNDFINAGPGDDYVQTGLGNDIVFGGDGNDAIFLQQGNDIAFGGAGDELIAGEEGNDLLSGDAGNDQLFGGGGADGLFGRDGDDQLFGMAGDDQLDGGDGNDLLDGGPGADSMKGGAGDDAYVVDDEGDDVIEVDDAGRDSGGNDTVKTTLNGYRLGKQTEHLELLDARQSLSPQSGHGNALSNRINGNREANTLYGYDGDDLIDGGTNADNMVGGRGNDLYIVDNAGDRVIEIEGEGVDTVKASVSYQLSQNAENLQLTGSGAINATGNALDNQLSGNAAANVLDGGAGADTLVGGAGDDTYGVDHDGDLVIEQANDGIDTVIASRDWGLGANLENLLLTGSADLQGFGNQLDNLMRGNRGSNLLRAGAGNDLLAGAAGNDGLDGGDGDDTYLIARGDGLDRIADASGRDTLRLSAGITPEQLSVRLIDTGHGLQAQLRFIDANGDEGKLEGVDIDTLSDDCNRILPALEEVDFSDGRVVPLTSLLTRVAEKRVWGRETDVTGSRDDDIIYGGFRASRLFGGIGNDALFGDGGSDSLSGGGGNDFLAGGRNNDTIATGSGYNVVAFNRNDGNDTVISSAGAVNTLSLGQGIALSDLALRKSGKDLVLAAGSRDSVTLKDWYANPSNRTLKTLQLIAPSGGFTASPQVTQIDFDEIFAQFDRSAAAAGNSPWQLMKAKLDAHLVKGSQAIGDELSVNYAQYAGCPMEAAAIAGALYRLDPTLAAKKLVSVDSPRA